MPAPTDALSGFLPPTARWFADAFPAPTRAQAAAWPAIQRGDHTLLVAPTGSGKTLAAFLVALDRLAGLPADAPEGVRVLYVSPLKALVVDIERNLRAPLAGIERTARLVDHPIRSVRVDVRTGDTSTRDRARQARHPGDVLVTTPESLYLLLTGRGREILRTVEHVIVDEVHVLAGTKRGVHLQLSLERLEALCDRPPQRVGLSATIRPLEVAARALAGERPVTLVDTSEPPRLDLQIVVPVDDMDAPPIPEAPPPPADDRPAFSYPTNQPRGGMWPALHPHLLAEIRSHTSTILFANSRLLCERLCNALNELAGHELVRAHHGSVSHEQRAAIEEDLKAGRLPGIVATSSLELGIDMGAVDLVLLVESPGSVARGLQRVGRAGHQVGATSVGRIYPKFKGDLLECAVVARHMIEGRIESTALPASCLDVLAQQIVAMACERDWHVPELWALVRRAGSYAGLSRALLDGVLDMLSGKYPSDELAELTPSLVWDRTTDVISARRNARLLAVLNGGTIPDRGVYRVRVGAGGPRVGELDEEMVYESRVGDHVVLGATTWRIDDIGRDEVIVTPAPGRTGRLPFWRGEKPGRPVELGRAMGAFLREVGGLDEAQALEFVRRYAPLDARAARNLVAHLAAQREATGVLPSDRQIVVERFRDELGDWRVCVLTPFGARVHAPWALLVERALAERTGIPVQALFSDDGIALRFADDDRPPDVERLLPDPDEVEAALVEALRDSATFAGRFRENAGRALLLPRTTARGRKPLWMQRKASQHLLAAVSRYPAFPIVLETYREVLQDAWDVPGLIDLLRAIRRREVRVEVVETRRPSPFARGLVFQYVAAYLYDGDAPLAERRAAALTLDRGLLAELLGQDALQDLLDPAAIDEVEAELQHTAVDRQVDHLDGVADLLRRLGDLSHAEVAARCAVDPGPLVAGLVAARRAVWVRVAGEERLIGAEDAARYRDGLGVVLPPALPVALLGPAEAPVEGIVRRFARTRGPFAAAELASRYGWTEAYAGQLLRGLEGQGLLVRGALRPGRVDDWCDVDVLRRIKRRTLARLRHEVEPVAQEVLAAFLPAWQGVGGPREGIAGLLEVVAQLEGLPLPVAELDAILAARLRAWQPMWLDQLGAMGEVVWIGAHGREGEVALVRRDRVALLTEPPPTLEVAVPHASDAHRAIVAFLERRGACFLVELTGAVGDARLASDALWDLVWAGLVTNDTVAPLRAMAAPGKAPKLAGGRWSLVAGLRPPVEPSATEKGLARATALLDRYGVLSREVAHAEAIPGGWQALYAVLSALEDAGRARRGWFVDGLGSGQFATPGAVDRLRALREAEPAARWLPAGDPAQAWGAVLPWPATLHPDSRPRRSVGAQVGVVGGRPVAWLGPRSLVLFEGALEGDRLARVVAALKASLGYRSVQVDKVDGQPAHAVPWLASLLAAGFARDHKGLVLSR